MERCACRNEFSWSDVWIVDFSKVVMMMENKLKTNLKICPMFGDQCWYCSHETTARLHTKIEKNNSNGLYEPKGLGRTIIELGAYCNNACEWIEKLHYCPSRWLKTQPPMIVPNKKQTRKKTAQQTLRM